MAAPLRVLLVEDDDAYSQIVEATLTQGNHDQFVVERAETLKQALDALPKDPDAILLDLRLPDSESLETLDALVKAAPRGAIVVLTGTETRRADALEALRRGAQDYLTKVPMDREVLVRTIRHAVERRRIRSELEEANRGLARSNEALETFAYAVGHDLKAPLRAMSYHAKKVLKSVEEGSDTAAEAQEIMSRIRRVQDMIDALLDYSRLGRVEDQEEETVDVNAVVQDCIGLIRAPGGFTIEVEGSLPSVPASPVRLQQLFMNLLSNAVHHHDRSDGRVVVRGQRTAQGFRFEVEDDGPGVPASRADRLFDLFTRGEDASSEGTGVGLALVRKIVEDNGGHVWVEQPAGRGARFVFTWNEDSAGEATS